MPEQISSHLLDSLDKLMKKNFVFFCLFIITTILTACSPPTPAPEEVEGVPTNEVAADENEKVFIPAIQFPENASLVPEGAPLAEWRSPAGSLFPIMPGAIAGEEVDGTYEFTIAAQIPDVENYYLETLGVQGWVPVSLGQGPDSMVFVLQKGDASLAISISFLPDSGLSYVKLGD